jgi:clan AA aspartic protease
MGSTYVTVAVSNPADPERRWQGLFLVDTGAMDCYIPSRHLNAIGIRPESKGVYELADGSEVVMEVGIARLEIMGEMIGATVVFGNDNAEPLLGVLALEALGIEVDPRTQRLKRLPARKLKQFRRSVEELELF